MVFGHSNNSWIGDLYPQSDAGRLIAFMVMLVGIGFVSMLNTAIDAHFVENDQEDSNLDIIDGIDELNEKTNTLSMQIEDLQNELQKCKK